jgi:hypothetical protein
MNALIYMLLTVVAALFVLWDGAQRGAARAGWTVAALVAWPIALPLWMATRPLRVGERRVGGRAWNVLRYFTLVWTILWGVKLVVVLGLRLAPLLAVIYVGIWIVPALGALLLGLALRKQAIVEHGAVPAARAT